MTPRQREQFSRLQRDIHQLDRALQRLQREADELHTLLEPIVTDEPDFTAEEIGRLVQLNERLGFLECYLDQCSQDISEQMRARLADPNDPLDDFEIDVTLHFMMREDDPGYEDDSDNFLTERRFAMKGFDSVPRLGRDWREEGHPFPGRLNRVAHCWLFHDLYDHSYGIDQRALSLHSCLRIDKIWVRVAVEHQATLDLESGDWEAPAAV